MNSLYGSVVTGIITDENNSHYFVQHQGITYALDKKEGMFQLGDTLNGFIYESNQRVKRITTNIPKSLVGKYAWGTVTQVRKDLGVFVDIGLDDKDIVVSLDDLPELKHLWPKKGDRLMIALKTDNKDRLWGELASDTLFRKVAKKGDATLKNKDIRGIVYRLKLVGTYLLTDEFYIGFIHPSERGEEPRLGELIEGRVIGVRRDGILNISLRQRAHEAIDDDSQMILAVLQQSNGYLSLHDKSDPELIKNQLGISKGQFKRAVGRLLKTRKITLESEGIKLVDNNDEN